MQKKFWVLIFITMFGTNIPTIDASSTTNNSNKTTNKKKKSKKITKKTNKRRLDHDNYSQVIKPAGTFDNKEEPIKRYQKNINYKTDHFASRVPIDPNAQEDDSMTNYFAANT